MRTVTLVEFLTEAQIQHCCRLWAMHGGDGQRFRQLVLQDVIRPSMVEIDRKLGQPNDPAYLSYAVLHVFMRAAV